MKNIFYIIWENEYSQIKSAIEMPIGNKFSGPFKSLNDAKKILIPFLETKIDDTRKNLQEIRALRPDIFEEEIVFQEKDDL